ncbi:MAG TPA: nucleoside hydrolase [Candidatus Saccharibacteria bacterium]|nr:nucleoside hydrolase [Candidatus Saccharibacteria bacterium]
MKNSMTRYIIDTDPGVDDAVALLYCSLMKFNVVGLTAVHGNSSIEHITNNTLYLRDALFDKKVGVYKGSSVSLDGNRYYAKSSGSSGLGNLKVPASNEFSDKSAVDFIADTLRTHEKTDIIALGPLTNIATLCNFYPELVKNINALYIMGGVFGERGNMSEFAEFNVYCDPSAFKTVIDFCSEKGINTVIVPADVCRKVLLTADDMSNLEKLTSQLDLASIVRPYLEYYEHDKEYGGFAGAVVYDLLVPLYIKYPKIFESVNARVHVVTDQNKEHDLTTFIPDERSCIKIARTVQADKIKQKFLDDMKRATSQAQ